ncbi:MAG: hypothetical protein OEV28_03460 [Nitrospirota bacterium]|nr:hypothetical protein [Nitrospirota bacterium]
MKIPTTLLALSLVLVTSFTACAHYCSDVPTVVHQKQDGTRLEIWVPSDVMTKTPKWIPGDGEPPLSVRDAISIAQNWARSKFSRYDRVDIVDIDLFGRSCWAAEGHWFYIVHFTPVINGRPVLDTSHFVAILMDGTVVEAVRGR